ncbi:hypothetical protein KCU91_g17965, partial [Aureobasidium melanogenum]
YKYNDELTMTFMTSNLIGGFFTRLEASRKYIFGAASVYGTSNDSIVRGAFLVRGQEALPAFDVAPDVESYEFTKLDPKNPEDKKFVEDMWAWDAPIQPEGKEWADGKVFNTIDPTTICVPVMVHFPNEIWLGVTNYLKLPTDVCTRKNEALDKDEKVTQQTLISLCLVYKQLRAVFQPQLYCSFIKHQRPTAKDRLLKSDSEWLYKYYQQDERSFRAIRKQTRLENFLVTIIQRPDLAAMVEQLRVGSFTQDDTHEEVFLHKATPPSAESGSSESTTYSGLMTYTIAIKDFVPLAEYIVAFQKPPVKVPSAFVKSLDRAIALRQKHNSWFKDIGRSSKGDGHTFFLGVLEQVREILRSRMPSDTVIDPMPQPLASLESKATSRTHIRNAFMDLSLNDPSGARDKYSDLTSIPNYFKLPTEVDDEACYRVENFLMAEEKDLAVHCLSIDIDPIIQSTWRLCVQNKTYSSRDSHVVTHRSTNLPFNCLCMAERTGCPVFS